MSAGTTDPLTKLKSIDPEVLSTYEQLKQKYTAALAAQRKGDEQIRDLERQSRVKQLILTQLSQLESDAVTYKNVGKAYVLAPRAEIINSYEEAYVENMATLKKRKTDKAVVDKSVQSSLDELREHLASHPVLSHAVLQSRGA